MATIDIQIATGEAPTPSTEDLRRWCESALPDDKRDAEIALQVVDAAAIQTLNKDYRGKDKATNVLSFPSDLPPEVELDHLGDILICAAVVAEEAQEQQKSAEAHWAHMVVHGTLHLLGYDHIDEQDAIEMETLETHILHGLGYSDPYGATRC